MDRFETGGEDIHRITMEGSECALYIYSGRTEEGNPSVSVELQGRMVAP